MSRIGRLPISIPNGVVVELEGDIVKVNGPRGSLEYRVPRG
ncbi:MAG: 50S ribosomal protein L6, partial [Thermodesulfobacteriota bacterium]